MAAEFNIVAGSKENVIVDVTDATTGTTDLAPLSPQFDVVSEGGTAKQTNVACVATAMRLTCLVDTTAGGTWATGLYRLYVHFTAGTEIPRLGPVEFYVV